MAKSSIVNLLWLLEDELPAVTTNNVDALPTPDGATQVPDVSLDQLVDRYLIQYEKTAAPQPSLLESFLFEADGDPPADDTPAPDAASVPDAGTGTDDSSGGSGDGSTGSGEGPKTPTPQMNIAVFANGVARLIKNFDALVNPRLVVLQRAYLYVSKNYSETAAKELALDLEKRFGLSVKSMQQKEGQKQQPPFAYNSIPGGSGGGGA